VEDWLDCHLDFAILGQFATGRARCNPSDGYAFLGRMPRTSHPTGCTGWRLCDAAQILYIAAGERNWSQAIERQLRIVGTSLLDTER
jgi:hypothetical protein